MLLPGVSKRPLASQSCSNFYRAPECKVKPQVESGHPPQQLPAQQASTWKMPGSSQELGKALQGTGGHSVDVFFPG